MSQLDLLLSPLLPSSPLPDGHATPALSPLGSEAPNTTLSAEDLVFTEKMEVMYREVAHTFITKLSPCNYMLRTGFVIHASNPTSNSGQNSRSYHASPLLLMLLFFLLQSTFIPEIQISSQT